MLKKFIIAGVAALLLSGLVFGRNAASYLGTAWGRAKDTVRSAVPIDFEIERARGMIQALVPDIRANMHRIAKEEVEVERLTKQINVDEQKLAKDRDEMLRLKTDLASGQKTFQYASRKYTPADVKDDLARRFERYKTSEATLKSMQDMLAARQQSLEGAKQKLDNMLAAKRQLEVDVEHLEARLQMVEAAQASSEFAFDDSRLSRTKELMTDLRTRLDVAEKLVHCETNFQGEIPLDAPASDNIVDEVTEYFHESDTGAAKLATHDTEL